MPDTDPGIVDVSDWLFIEDENSGRAAKMWLRPLDLPNEPENRWLFKPCHVHKNGTVQGTDWSEKIAAGIAEALSVPSAQVEQASRHGELGSISRNVRRAPFELHGGAVWLDAHPDVAYVAPSSSSSRKRRKSKGHSLGNIAISLRAVAPPPGSEQRIETSYDAFVGMLLLDAVISNQDRHESNWAILRASVGSEPETLSPVYDNGSSLGFQLDDARRERLLMSDPELKDYTRKAMAVRFDHGELDTPNLVDFAVSAFGHCSRDAQAFWMEKVENLTPELLEAIVNRPVEMSDVQRSFATTITTTNAERLRNGLRSGYSPG